jgi:hypothetical protein
MAGDTKRNVRDDRVGNLLDTFLFIPGYTGFLFATGALLARTDSRLHRIGLLLALVAVPTVAICDWAENLGIANTLDDIAQDGAPHGGDARRISVFSMVKWTLLAVSLVIYGWTGAGAGKGLAVTGFGIALAIGGVLMAIRMGGYFLIRFL